MMKILEAILEALCVVGVVEFILLFPVAVFAFMTHIRQRTRMEREALEAQKTSVAEKASMELASMRKEMSSLKEMLADVILEQGHQRKLPSEKPEEVSRR